MAFTEKTTIPIIDYSDDYGYKKKKVLISPDMFLRLAQKTSGDAQSRLMPLAEYEKFVTFDSSVERAMKGLKSSKRVVPAPYIEFRDGLAKEHEGRNRAVAAKRLGREQIPVWLLWKQGDTPPPSDLGSVQPYWRDY